MTFEQIENAFAEVIAREGIYNQLNLKKNTVAQYRWKLKRGIKITLDKKVSILQRAGYNIQAFEYSRFDMVDVLRFAFRTSENARSMGPEYVFEKWMANNNADEGKLKY